MSIILITIITFISFIALIILYYYLHHLNYLYVNYLYYLCNLNELCCLNSTLLIITVLTFNIPVHTVPGFILITSMSNCPLAHMRMRRRRDETFKMTKSQVITRCVRNSSKCNGTHIKYVKTFPSSRHSQSL